MIWYYYDLLYAIFHNVKNIIATVLYLPDSIYPKNVIEKNCIRLTLVVKFSLDLTSALDVEKVLLVNPSLWTQNIRAARTIDDKNSIHYYYYDYVCCLLLNYYYRVDCVFVIGWNFEKATTIISEMYVIVIFYYEWWPMILIYYILVTNIPYWYLLFYKIFKIYWSIAIRSILYNRFREL